MDQIGLRQDRDNLSNKAILTEGETEQFKRFQRRETEIAVQKYNDLKRTFEDERIRLQVILDRNEAEIKKIKQENEKLKSEKVESKNNQ